MESVEEYKEDLLSHSPLHGENDDEEALVVPLGTESENIQDDTPSAAQSPSIVSYVSSNYEYRCGFVLGSIANLCSATLGAGVLALPYALHQAGLIFGTLLLLASAAATTLSIDLLVQSCETHQKFSYEQLVLQLYGAGPCKLVELCIVMFCLGCAVAYVIAVGDIIEQSKSYLWDAIDHNSEDITMILVWAVAMLPLSCLRSMESLQCASAVGMASIGTLVVAALAHLLQQDDETPHEKPLSHLVAGHLKESLWPRRGVLSVIRACPIVLFAFSCQINVCAIYYELPDTSSKLHDMARVARIGVTACTLLYLSISLIALMDFGKHVPPNILSGYDPKSAEVLQVAFSAMALAVVMAFPLNVFPARVTLRGMLHTKHPQRPSFPTTPLVLDSTTDIVGLEEPLLQLEPGADMTVHGSDDESCWSALCTRSSSHLQHYGLTLAIAGLALGLALVLPNISVVFGLIGGTVSSTLGFVVPGLLGLKEHEESTMHKFKCWSLVAGGILVGLLTTSVTVYHTFWDH